MNLVENLVNYFSIGAPAIWIDSFEEGVAVDAIYKAARQVCDSKLWGGYSVFEWSEGFGGHRMNTTNRQPISSEEEDGMLNFELDDANPNSVNELPPSAQALLKFVKDLQDQEIVSNVTNAEIMIIKEMSDINQDKIKRCIRDLKELGTVKKNNNYYPLVVIAPSGNIPFNLQKLFVTMTCPLPTVPEIEKTISYFNKKHGIEWDDEKINSIANAAAGLTFSEIRRCFDLSYHLKGELDHDIITKEKINAIQKSGILTYRQPKLTIDDIGGHTALKQWIIETKRCMRKDAKKFKVKTARGYLSLGMPGAGKTAIAEAIANYFEVPFVILDLSKIMGGIVGESERNAQAAFQVLDSIGKCVVLLDEVEKNLGGVKSSNRSDGGTMARVFGVILDHLNTNTDQFYIMTSNNVADLPPELTRSGRLDTKWFFDFPRLEDRKEIFKIHFGKADKELSDTLLDFAANKSKHFTGAEIENAVNNIVKNAFFRMINNGTDGSINEEDITKGIEKVNTVYDTNMAEVKALQNYVARNKIPSTVTVEANSHLTTSNTKAGVKESPYSFMDDAIVGR